MPCKVKLGSERGRKSHFSGPSRTCREPALASNNSERYVFVGDFRRVRSLVSVLGSLIESRASGSAARSLRFAALAAAALAAPAQQDQVLGDDLRAVLLLAALFVFPA